ncbi:MAG: dephospho-CoA kinase [Chloroflexi bacterium]|nr:dephospho-CoA kinase [Chloroflexota bacterium]
MKKRFKKKNRPYTIGLTGGIASGKNFVAEVLVRHGAYLLDADKAAREVVSPGSPVLESIFEKFGCEYRLSDGTLDRKALASRVFSDPEALKDLNALTHPAIMDMLEFDLRKCGGKIAVIMAPVLLEAGGREWVDEVWLVDVRPGVQVKRLMKRDGMDRAEAEKRIRSQMQPEKKRKMADIIIDNNGNRKTTASHVRRLWDELNRRLG